MLNTTVKPRSDEQVFLISARPGGGRGEGGGARESTSPQTIHARAIELECKCRSGNHNSIIVDKIVTMLDNTT